MPESKFVTDAMVGVEEHKRLLDAMYERRLIDAAIETASMRIASGFSTEAQTEYDERVRRLRLSTWGES
jgi:hypothetical protein